MRCPSLNQHRYFHQLELHSQRLFLGNCHRTTNPLGWKLSTYLVLESQTKYAMWVRQLFVRTHFNASLLLSIFAINSRLYKK